tara:strand:+ start:41 stop:736 length:696 start_codon:yes stop_codon:yes gene_type:complete
MTLNEIAYNIKNLVEGGMSGEDSNLSITQIKHMVHYHRANLLTRYTDSGRYISESMLQTVSASNTSGSTTIPLILGWPSNRALKEVMLRESTSSVDKIYNLSIVLPSERDFFLNTRFAPNQNQFFCEYDNGIIRILTSDGSVYSNSNQTINVKAVFENPSSAPGGGSNYPIPAELVGSLVENVLAKEFNIYLRVSADATNNSVDEAGGKMATPTVSASPNANARSRRGRTR